MSFVKIPKRITLFDDEARIDAANLHGARSEILKEPIGAINYAACRYRPLYSFWQLDGLDSDHHNEAQLLRTLWMNSSPGAPGLRAKFLAIPSTDATSTTRYITQFISSSFAAGNADFSDVSYAPRSKTSGEDYPADVVVLDGLGAHESYADDLIYEASIGSLDAEGPSVFAGIVYEPMNFEPRYINPVQTEGLIPEKHQAIPTDWIGPGLPVLGAEDPTEATGDIRSLSQVRTFFRRVYQNKRIHFGWSAVPGHTLNFPSGSPGDWFYVLDQNIGSARTAPTATGPGITIPTNKSGSGRNGTTRIYVSVYAELGGSNGSAQFGVYTSDAILGITGPTLLTNTPVITGPGISWYPGFGSAFDPDTHPYFEMRTDGISNHERVVLCVKRTGTSVPVVGGFVMFGYETT